MTDYEPQWQPLRFCSRCAAPIGERLVHGRMRPACPRCGYVVYINPKVACGALLALEGRVLLVRRRHEPGRGLWCLPCGFAEADEPPEQAARRELHEETGLTATLEGLLGAYHYTDDPRGAGLLLVYRASCADLGALAAGDDADDARFFAPEALPPISHHTHQRALEDWMQLR
jgi:ADP-ribose pyrophosphatase YjhB (NUDIX family)